MSSIASLIRNLSRDEIAIGFEIDSCGDIAEVVLQIVVAELFHDPFDQHVTWVVQTRHAVFEVLEALVGTAFAFVENVIPQFLVIRVGLNQPLSVGTPRRSATSGIVSPSVS